MTRFIAIEGGDGAGKNTAAKNLKEVLESHGHLTKIISFPRYGDTIAGFALGEYLSGRLSVSVSAKAAATMYAVDRYEAVELITTAADQHAVIIFDRYIASNVAYQSANVDNDERDALIHWIIHLELEIFGLKCPDVSVYLDTPIEDARNLMLLKAKRAYTDEDYDKYEGDVKLQNKIRLNYKAMTKMGLLGPWVTVETTHEGALKDPKKIANEIFKKISPQLFPQF